MAGNSSIDLEDVQEYYIYLAPCPPPVMSVSDVYDHAQTGNVSTDIIDKILTICGYYEYTEPSTASQKKTDQSTTVSWAGHSTSASTDFTTDSSSEQASFLEWGLIIGIAVLLLIVLVLVLGLVF